MFGEEKKNSIDKAYLVVGIVQPKMFFGENLSVLCFTAGFLFGLHGNKSKKNLIYATYADDTIEETYARYEATE